MSWTEELFADTELKIKIKNKIKQTKHQQTNKQKPNKIPICPSPSKNKHFRVENLTARCWVKEGIMVDRNRLFSLLRYYKNFWKLKDK